MGGCLLTTFVKGFDQPQQQRKRRVLQIGPPVVLALFFTLATCALTVPWVHPNPDLLKYCETLQDLLRDRTVPC